MNETFEVIQNSSESFCPKCNNKTEECYNFCPTCGYKLKEDILGELVEKLLHSINKNFYTQIEIQDMMINQFVVINMRDEYLYVAIHPNTDKELVNNLCKQKFIYPLKFILLSQRDLATLLFISCKQLDLL